MLEEETLREAYAAAETSVPHLSEESWERFACGELSRAERERALEHVSRCLECGRVLRGLVLLEGEARAVDPLVPAGLSISAPRLRTRFLWAAAAAAAAAILWLTIPLRSPALPGTSSTPADALRSSAATERPTARSPRGEVGSAPEVFSWDGIPDARAYRVELLDLNGESIWRSGEVEETTVSGPLDVAREPGRYYWRVVAILEERGESIASPLVSFDIRPTR